MSIDYVGYFLNARAAVVQLDTLELSHPNFTKTYRVVRNKIAGLTATLETSATVTFDYYPLRLTPLETRENLDYGIKVEFGDLGQALPQEIDAIAAADGFATKPTIIYRAFRSDDLSGPMFGPVTLEASPLAFNRDGAAFEARAPQLNINKTGEVYTITRFPMLRGLL